MTRETPRAPPSDLPPLCRQRAPLSGQTDPSNEVFWNDSELSYCDTVPDQTRGRVEDGWSYRIFLLPILTEGGGGGVLFLFLYLRV